MSLELDQFFRYRNYPSPVKGRGRRWQHTHTHTCCMKSTFSSNLLYDQSQFKIRTFHHPDLGKLMYEHIYIFVHGCLYIYIYLCIIFTINYYKFNISISIYIYTYVIHNIYTCFSNTLSLWSLTYFTSKLGKAFYSGQPQTLSFYHTVKRLGIPDSQIILMMAEVGITLDLMLWGSRSTG